VSARIDIVNKALGMLGESPITALTDDSDKARTMLNLYYLTRDALLEAHEWSFAIRQFSPVKSTTDPVWDWAYSYPLPSDIIRLLRVDRGTTNGMTRNQIDHVVMGGNILCNEEPIYCTGIAKIDEEGEYSPLFANAFSYRLAMDAAIPITESNSKHASMVALYAQAMNEAKSRDGMQSTTVRQRSHWLRRSRGSRGNL
jgi:hypothetical protein